MTNTTKAYRPQVGKTLFIAFMAEKPFLVTVTGFHFDKRFTSEQFEFTESSTGKKKTSSLDSYKFFPDTSVDATFVYCVTQVSPSENYSVEEAYFFDPQSAFDHIEALEKGHTKSRLGDNADDRAFNVLVEKVS